MKNTYGTPKSKLLQKIKDKGFNPIGICIMICEETFVFETDKESKEAHKAMDTNEGWWYGLNDGECPFTKTLKDYREQFYKGEEHLHKMHWLNKK